jgi:hypothetical protein
VAHSSFTEGAQMTKNMASELNKIITEEYFQLHYNYLQITGTENIYKSHENSQAWMASFLSERGSN